MAAVSYGPDFDRIHRELGEARRSDGGPYQSTVQNVIQTQFQSAAAFGNTATASVLHSSPTLKSVELVVNVPLVTTVTGTPAWPQDVSTIIQTLLVNYGGNQIVNMTGTQIAIINKSRSSISGLQALESCVLCDQTLAQRQAVAAAAATFIIHLPLPCDDGAIPYSLCASDLQIMITFNSLNNILEAGTGTCTMTSAYLNCTFLPPQPGMSSIDADIVAAAEAAGASGVDRLYRDEYQMQFALLAGTTAFTAQLNQLRNDVKQILFYIVANSDLNTAGAYKWNNFLPVSTMQMSVGGNNVFSQQPIACDYLRLRALPNSGFLNFSSEKIYGFVPDGGEEGNDHVAIDVPYGGGLQVGPANTGAPELVLTFPALGANSTLFVVVEAWNALRYTSVGGGMVNFRKVLT